MNTFSKTTLMAVSLMTLAGGAAYADGEQLDPASNIQYNDSQTQAEQGPAPMSQDTMGNQPPVQDEQAEHLKPEGDRLSSADIKDVQESLKNEGYDVAVDGVLGQATKEAIMAFQSQNADLNPTGELDPQTVAKLDVDLDGSRDLW